MSETIEELGAIERAAEYAATDFWRTEIQPSLCDQETTAYLRAIGRDDVGNNASDHPKYPEYQRLCADRDEKKRAYLDAVFG